MDEILIKLESMRKKAMTFVLIAAALMIAGFVLVTTVGFLAFPLIIAGVVFIFVSVKASKNFAREYKSHIVSATLNEIFTDMQFSPKNGISCGTIDATGMMNTGDRFSSNDLITGKYNGVDFCQSDVHIEVESTDSDGNTTYSTLFQGRWMIFEFNKTFHCDMQVVAPFFGAAKRKGGLFSRKENKMPRVKFENETFNKAFHVYAHDQQEAFYIMTPHMMEAILTLKQKCKSPIMLLFVGGSLHVAVNNHKDAFEPHLFRKIVPEKEKEYILSDIRVITDFVDEMKLDNDIYKQ